MLEQEEVEYYKLLGKKFSILHVKDNKSENLFENFFQNVYYTDSYEDAISIYRDKSCDMVFIDVATEDLSWLKLVTSLRKIVYDLPIAIITDLSNTDRLTTAITVGITQCIFKPVDSKRLELVVFDMINKLQNKLDAKELFRKKEQERLSDIATKSAQKIVEDIPQPMFAFTKDRLLFANKELYKLFSAKKIALKQSICLKDIEELFINYTQDISFESIKKGKSLDVHYHYQDLSLKKIFIPNKFNILLDGADKECSVVVLSDIAPFMMQVKMLNYQNNKLTNYKELIEKLLAKQMFANSSKSVIEEIKTTSIQEPIQNQTQKVDEKLGDREIKILRKSVQLKISAVDYVCDIDADSIEDVQELYSVEEDLQVAIDSYIINQSGEDLKNIAKLFRIYGNVVNALMEFIDLGNSIYSLSNFLHELSYIDTREFSQKISIYIENVLHDLCSWRENIFEKQVATDIHYLDSSIFSSVLQLQLTLNEDDDSGEDLELF